MQLTHIAFLRQFREEEIELPRQDRQYRNTFLRPFSCTRKEKNLLTRFLDQEIAHSLVITALIAKIGNEDLNSSRQLLAYANKILKQFAGYAREEPQTGRYYRNVSETIYQLLEAVELCRDATQHRVQRMKAVVGGKKACPFSAGDLRDIRLVLCQYIDVLTNHHEALTILLEHGSDHPGRVRLATRVELSVFRLRRLLEEEMTAIESTAIQVEVWRMRLCSLAVQEIYN